MKTNRQSPEPRRFALTSSRKLTAWMAEQNLSLAFTTDQAGKVFRLGLQPHGRLDIFKRSFERCMGLCVTRGRLWLSSQYQLWRFENALEPGQSYQGYDRLYVPRLAHTTGDLDIHDVAVDSRERPVFVNTLFSCLATVSERYRFAPLWQAPFISKLAAEDRCHLNGLHTGLSMPHSPRVYRDPASTAPSLDCPWTKTLRRDRPRPAMAWP
jgi:uncharacterized protein (TIGR03032 family)